MFSTWACLFGNPSCRRRRCAQEPLRLENSQIGLTFDGKAGTLTAIENKLVGETYQIRGEEFGIEASEFKVRRAI